MRFSSIHALAASLSTAAAVSQGFNYGSTKADGTYNYQADFESLFTDAKGLIGTDSGFTSARLYTMIQGGSSTNQPIEAIPAAISTDTTLLLGLWASGGSSDFAAEITALKSAITQYGDDFAKLVVGISVGSEDLYRNSPTGVAADAGVGVDAATVAAYIVQLKDAISGTILSDVPVGHVDTWTGWAESGDANIDWVIGNCSWIGMDAYPYFQNTESNSISDGKSLFAAALATTQAAVGSKPVWITETGWPVSGKTENLGVPSLANAKTYWDEVGCPIFGVTNTWWYTLQDTNGATTDPSFGVIGSSYSTTPLYDLSCSNVSSSSSSSSSGSSSTKASSSSSTAVAGGSGSVSTSGVAASSGSGLSPSEGAGNGISATATATGSTSSQTGVSGSNSTASGNSTVPAGTATSGLATATKSGSSTSTSSVTVSTNAASVISGSFVGVMGALFVAIAAL